MGGPHWAGSATPQVLAMHDAHAVPAEAPRQKSDMQTSWHPPMMTGCSQAHWAQLAGVHWSVGWQERVTPSQHGDPAAAAPWLAHCASVEQMQLGGHDAPRIVSVSVSSTFVVDAPHAGAPTTATMPTAASATPAWTLQNLTSTSR
jgi:hypothetical protein